MIKSNYYFYLLMGSSKFFTPVTITSALIALVIGGFCSVLLAWAEGNIENTISTATSTQKSENLTSNKENKDNKIYNKAIYYKDIQACDFIESENEKESCKNSLLIIEAKKTHNIDICQQITDDKQKDTCKSVSTEQKAYYSSNKNLCNHIEDINSRIRCKKNIDIWSIALLQNGKNINNINCSLMETDLQEICFYYVNKEKEEKKFIKILQDKKIHQCHELNDANLSQNCRNILLKESAEEKLNINTCNQINNDEQKQECTQNVQQKIDQKIFKNALEEGNIPLCDNISDSTLKNNCNDTIIFKLVKQHKSTSLCEFVKHPEHKNICKQVLNF